MAPPDIVLRGIPALQDEDRFIRDLREQIEGCLDCAADDDVHEVDLLEKILHDDLADFVHRRLKRRPMILPVVVEV